MARTQVFVLIASFAFAQGSVISIEDHGAKANDDTAATTNTNAILASFKSANQGDTILVPKGKIFTILGTYIQDVFNMTLQIDGTLKASSVIQDWINSTEHVLQFQNASYLTITSSSPPSRSEPSIDGQGYNWWWREILQTLPRDRPKLLVLSESDNLLIENLFVMDSPSWTVVLDDVADAKIQNTYVHTDVDAQKDLLKSAGLTMHISKLFPTVPWKEWLADLLIDLHIPTFPLNTDGIDISGRNVHVRNVTVVNFDDSIVPKPCNSGCKNANCTENILIEDVIAFGVGMSIGSVPPNSAHNCVNNVTMRNVKMINTLKGIYVKTNPGDSGTGIVSNILFENFDIIRPFWWAIWIGPQQQNQPGWGPGDHPECKLDFPISDKCMTQPLVVIQNITLRNINIQNPLLSPGVIRCNESRYDEPGKPSCDNIVFDGVKVTGVSTNYPYGPQYGCWNVENSSAIDSNPVPTCFNQGMLLDNRMKLKDAVRPDDSQLIYRVA